MKASQLTLTCMALAGAALLALVLVLPRTDTTDRSTPSMEPRHPHPISAEHLRLYREADQLDAALRAVVARDFVQARALLAQHRRERAPRKSVDADGLERLADCVEHPDAATRARAQQFYDEQTQSSVRRRLRMLCLQPTPSAPAPRPTA